MNLKRLKQAIRMSGRKGRTSWYKGRRVTAMKVDEAPYDIWKDMIEYMETEFNYGLPDGVEDEEDLKQQFTEAYEEILDEYRELYPSLTEEEILDDIGDRDDIETLSYDIGGRGYQDAFYHAEGILESRKKRFEQAVSEEQYRPPIFRDHDQFDKMMEILEENEDEVLRSLKHISEGGGIDEEYDGFYTLDKNNWPITGWIMPDGKGLSLYEGKEDMRTLDHRSIVPYISRFTGDAMPYETEGYDRKNEILASMLGVIRFIPEAPAAMIFTTPTEEQIEFMSYVVEKNRSLYLSYRNEPEKEVHSTTELVNTLKRWGAT